MRGAYPKQRSVLWVVASHVGTTLLWTIILTFMMGCVLRGIGGFEAPSWREAVLTIGVAILSTIFATEHSLYYIEKRAVLLTPAACIAPSILIFAGLLASLLLLPILMARNVPRGINLLMFLGYLLGPVVAFGWLTRRRFLSMPTQEAVGFEGRPILHVEPLFTSSPPQERNEKSK